jgi:hypothetical protein
VQLDTNILQLVQLITQLKQLEFIPIDPTGQELKQFDPDR